MVYLYSKGIIKVDKYQFHSAKCDIAHDFFSSVGRLFFKIKYNRRKINGLNR